MTKLRKVIDRGYELRALQRNPHIVLLNPDFYHSDLKAIMMEWALESQHFTGVGEDEIRKYVLEGPQSDQNLAEKVESRVSRTHIKLLNLCRDWLRSFLPHCLQKIDRVTFGLLSKEDYERALAADPHMPRTRAKLGIPFVGKDVPSRSSEFAHPDIIIGLTILGYRYEGLRWTDFVDIIESLRATLTKETGPFNERKSSRLYNRWVKEAGGRIRGAPKYVVDEKDEDKNANDLADAVVSGEGPKTPRLQLDSDDKAKKGEAGRKEEEKAEEWRWCL